MWVAQTEIRFPARRIALLPAGSLTAGRPGELPLDVTRERGHPLGAPLPVGCNPRAPPAARRAPRRTAPDSPHPAAADVRRVSFGAEPGCG